MTLRSQLLKLSKQIGEDGRTDLAGAMRACALNLSTEDADARNQLRGFITDVRTDADGNQASDGPIVDELSRLLRTFLGKNVEYPNARQEPVETVSMSLEVRQRRVAKAEDLAADRQADEVFGVDAETGKALRMSTQDWMETIAGDGIVAVEAPAGMLLPDEMTESEVESVVNQLFNPRGAA